MNGITWRLHVWKHKRRYRKLASLMERECIADEKLPFSEMAKFTADKFPNSGPRPWLDRPDAPELIAQKLAAGEITESQADMARKYHDDGYVILEKFYSDEQLDSVWEDYERKLYEGKVPVEVQQQKEGDLYLGRCLNPHQTVPGIKTLTHDPRALEWLSLFLGVEAIPFQTISGHAGSSQKAHSDAIHMSTYPLGYLAAMWIAFEDIHEDSGPLEYYPGSHKLPYIFTGNLIKDGEVIPSEHKHTTWYNEVYEQAVQDTIEERGLERKLFLAKKGDMLIWHSNLIHGGSPRNDWALSRKAMVAHYFGKGAFCYGDRHENMMDPWSG